MKINATVFVDRLIGPFVDDALEQSTEAPTHEQSRKPRRKDLSKLGIGEKNQKRKSC